MNESLLKLFAHKTDGMLLLAFLTISLGMPVGTTRADQADWLDTVRRDYAGPGGVSTAEDASGVVNGQKSGTYEMHTGQDNSPWWQVDLGPDHSRSPESSFTRRTTTNDWPV